MQKSSVRTTENDKFAVNVNIATDNIRAVMMTWGRCNDFHLFIFIAMIISYKQLHLKLKMCFLEKVKTLF